ncbi:Gfo/Idh/MocA family oxidoreductase [Sphaerisporangium sp. NPDC051011]|uniref:Gfo/Idh/MocA family protein n=1 Tax=Sphaerisporangium sp. NPDC051011 TaxID=3155792 RepID=UPI0033CBE86E
MTGSQIRVGVVGCGGAAFGIHLPVLADHPDFAVAAVHDRDPGRAEAAAARFGARARDLRTLLRTCDLVAVLTGVHEPLVEQALAAGRHVFVEKPVSLDLATSRRLLAAAAEAGLLLEVGVMRAYDPAVHALLAAAGSATVHARLIKRDSSDITARAPYLPAGFGPYTFEHDPIPAHPADLEGEQLQALKLLLRQGYHLLSVAVLADPELTPLACTLTAGGHGLRAELVGSAGARWDYELGDNPEGGYGEHVHLLAENTSVTLSFGPPYGPGSAACLITPSDGPGVGVSGFGNPFAAMWQAFADRMHHPAPALSLAASGDIALTVEGLAAALARLCPATTPGQLAGLEPMKAPSR